MIEPINLKYEQIKTMLKQQYFFMDGVEKYLQNWVTYFVELIRESAIQAMGIVIDLNTPTFKEEIGNDDQNVESDLFKHSRLSQLFFIKAANVAYSLFHYVDEATNEYAKNLHFKVWNSSSQSKFHPFGIFKSFFKSFFQNSLREFHSQLMMIIGSANVVIPILEVNLDFATEKSPEGLNDEKLFIDQLFEQAFHEYGFITMIEEPVLIEEDQSSRNEQNPSNVGNEDEDEEEESSL